MTLDRSALTVTDETGQVATEIVIGRGIDVALPERSSRKRVAVLHQPGPAGSLAHQVREGLADSFEVFVLEVPDGDSAKTWQTVAAVHEWLAERRVGRADTVVAVGGGAITDLGGFVAATWLRGVEAVYVPTTLLAAVDASIGGKTGINLAGKNLVGAFWHPATVVIDLDVLDSLPVGIKREGWAETIKAGFVADPGLVDVFRRHGEQASLDVVVPRAVAVKAAVVSADFREAGKRAILNFGHTIGHGVEFAGGTSHGEAVAIGMVAAAAASRHVFDFDSDIAELVAGLGLPIRSDASSSEVRSLLELDKKRDAAGLRMVLLRSYGDPVLHHVGRRTLDLSMAAVGLS